jgi:hypothetical protein
MKFLPSKRSAPAVDPSSPQTDRRGLVVGAGIAGVAALAAAALHRRTVAAPEAAVTTAAAPTEADGYQVTPHVLRYYETTRS